MKKEQFLNIVKGHKIECTFSNDRDDTMAHGTPVFSGLPEELQNFNPKDLLGRLKAMVPYSEQPHPDLAYWQSMADRMFFKEQKTGLGTFGASDIIDWLDWCERHPTLIFSYEANNENI